MTATLACPRERDVLDLVAIGQWPSKADQELRDHVAACLACADLALVAAAMTELAEDSRADSKVPDARLVWYRAQLRARDERVRLASRPMLLVQLAAGLVVVVLGLAAWQLSAPWILERWNGVASIGGPTSPWAAWTSLGGGEPPSAVWRWVGIAALAWIAAVPFAFYLAGLADRDGRAPADRTHQP